MYRYGLISLIDTLDNKEIYRKVDEYGNVLYFYIDLTKKIDINSYRISDFRNNGFYMQTKQTFYLNRLLSKNEEVKSYYDKYYGIFTYEEAMSIYQEYYQQVTKKEDRIECMNILGLCGVHYALAYICTLFKIKDKIVQTYARIKSYSQDIIFFIIKDKDYIDKEFSNLIEKDYTYYISASDICNIFSDEELHQLFVDVQDGEYYTDIITRKLFQDMLMCNDYIRKYTLIQLEKKLGQEEFRKVIKYRKKRTRKSK